MGFGGVIGGWGCVLLTLLDWGYGFWCVEGSAGGDGLEGCFKKIVIPAQAGIHSHDTIDRLLEYGSPPARG
jgi:hypothetical protein